jgi:hypothetical protein
MLIILVIGFAICWFPLQLFNLIFWLFDDLRIPSSKTYYYVYVGTYFACHWLSTGLKISSNSCRDFDFTFKLQEKFENNK